MSKILFTEKQVKELSKNKYIKKVSTKAITYTDEFKIRLINETIDFKKFPQDVFRECKINPDIIGQSRINNSAYRWRMQYKNTAGIKDSRKGASGRLLNRELSESEKLKRAEVKIKLLEAENELLKKTK